MLIYKKIHNKSISLSWHSNLRKYIKKHCQKNYLNILDFFLLAYLLYLIVAKYLTAKIERKKRIFVLFA